MLAIQEQLERRKNMVLFCMGPFKGLLFLGIKDVGIASALATSDFSELCGSKELATNIN